MAEKKQAPKPRAKRREVKDAGQRTVLAAIELRSNHVTKELARAAGVNVAAKDDELSKLLKPFYDRLGVGPDEPVQVWVKLGQVEADTREEAVNVVVGTEQPGEYRAPNASAWRGRVIRKIPDQIPLDVQVTDD